MNSTEVSIAHLNSLRCAPSYIFSSETISKGTPDLWELSLNVSALLINGERMLDFPRPLPNHIAFSGELGLKKCERSGTDKHGRKETALGHSICAALFSCEESRIRC